MNLLLKAEEKDSLPRSQSPAPHDLDRALAEVFEEVQFNWPDFLSVERIKAGIAEIALGLFLFAGLVAFCGFR
jgi:hypothetical protein